MDLVPVVDIAHPEDTSLAALDRACADHGFFLLSGHGLDDVIADTFAMARRFFDADPDVKNGVRRDERIPLGYNDRELTKRRRDHKEVFDFVDPVGGRSAHHTDLGVLTLLIQDGVGGLQARSEEHGWIDVEPRPGTIVVNLADCMQVWTNDRYRAAVHRVLPMGDRDRMSVPYFLNPPREAVIEPIAALAGTTPVYRPFAFRDFITARGADNYADLGADDTQIAGYRIAGYA